MVIYIARLALASEYEENVGHTFSRAVETLWQMVEIQRQGLTEVPVVLVDARAHVPVS